jgi:hypothetical protein
MALMEAVKRISIFIETLRRFLDVDNGGKQGVTKSAFISILPNPSFEIGPGGGIAQPP